MSFRPVDLPSWFRFQLSGRRVLRQALREVAALPTAASSPERTAVQAQVGLRLARHLRMQVQVSGLTHIQSEPYLVLALHEGIADVLALLHLPLPLRFVARDEIFRWAGVGKAITTLGHVSITPESGASGYRKMLAAARDVTAQGESLVIFPQGTVLGIETDFQRGAFALARHAGLPILPVVLTGSHRVWDYPFTPTLRYGQSIGLHVLPPITRDEVRTTSPDLLRVQVRRAMKRAALDPELPSPRRYDPERDGYWDGYRFDIDPDFSALHHLMTTHRARRTEARP
ncbi:lysophospholipid acyltransferase family protein [Deinococcus oregonensis]|uniref:Lysophospholipid acyltransferase family protein n=1 Tax=Deinococcus oregonensis TaxID=1805970 RepID=A0ABV6ATH7_9DEIO